MTRDDIIRMAREAGHAIRNIDGEDEVMDGDNYHIQTDLIECFANLVAAAEREACAQIAFDADHMGSVNLKLMKNRIGNAIRARWNT